MRVEVTREDIAHGERGNCEHCPVARALERATGSPCVHVGHSGMYAGKSDDSETVWDTPLRVLRFMDSFDKGKRVRPFAFDLGEPRRRSRGRDAAIRGGR